MKKKKIFLLYPYYWPHYKAGGPVQSLFNLVNLFQESAEFFLVALNRDIDGSVSDKNVLTGVWSKGPNSENIYFTSSFSFRLIWNLIREVKPDVLFLNGIFNIQTTLPGAIIGKYLGIRIIISPRGMLQAWALQRSSIVKKVFLAFLKLILSKREVWHATDQQEFKDIQYHFGQLQSVHIASNVPRSISPFTPLPFPTNDGRIRLIFLSLINRNKNLHLVMDAVNQNNGKFTLDIYGPAIDKGYWEECAAFLNKDYITYRGPVPPWEVPNLLPSFHFFVLPTEGENFGHAIFDSLASGVPVIISRKTPWQDIERKGSGFYIDLVGADSLVKILQTISTMNPDEYLKLRQQSLRYATEYWHNTPYVQDYSFLLGSGTD